MPQRSAALVARQTMTVLVIIGALVCFTMAMAVLVFLFAPADRDTSTLITVLFAQLPTTVTALVAVVGVRGVDAKVEQVADDTQRLANGLGDAKFRSAVAEVVDPRYHAAAYRHSDQPEQDRAVVDRRHAEAEAAADE